MLLWNMIHSFMSEWEFQLALKVQNNWVKEISSLPLFFIYNFLPFFQYIEVLLNIIFFLPLLGQNRSGKKIKAEFPSQSLQPQRTHQKTHWLPVHVILWFLFYSSWKQRRTTRIFGTYSTTESTTFSRKSLLFSERGCQDPVVALDSFTFFEEPFSPVTTKEKREKYDLSNLDRQLHDSVQSDRSQRCNSSDLTGKNRTLPAGEWSFSSLTSLLTVRGTCWREKFTANVAILRHSLLCNHSSSSVNTLRQCLTEVFDSGHKKRLLKRALHTGHFLGRPMLS